MAPVVNDTETIPDNWRECPHCGLISALPAMCPELTADCPRCQHVLWRMRSCNFELPLACALAGALFFFYAVIAPFLEISSYGQFQLARLVTGPYQLAAQGFGTIGLLVLGSVFLIPSALPSGWLFWGDLLTGNAWHLSSPRHNGKNWFPPHPI